MSACHFLDKSPGRRQRRRRRKGDMENGRSQLLFARSICILSHKKSGVFLFTFDFQKSKQNPDRQLSIWKSTSLMVRASNFEKMSKEVSNEVILADLDFLQSNFG